MYSKAKRFAESLAFEYWNFDKNENKLKERLKKSFKKHYKHPKKQINEALEYLEELLELKEDKKYSAIQVDFPGGHMTYYDVTPKEAKKQCRKDLNNGMFGEDEETEITKVTRSIIALHI